MNLLKRRYGRVRFHFVDIVCMAYLLSIGFLLLFFHRFIPSWPLYVVIHVFVVIFILEIVRWGGHNQDKKIQWFIRTFYPIAFILFAWRELDALIPMFFGRYWATDVIIRMEKSIFGVLPNVWFQQFYKPWLDELMHVLYSGYYFFMPLVGLILYFKKRYKAALAAFSIGMFTYCVNFLLFFLFPVLAPFMAEGMVDHDIGSWTGYFVADCTQYLQSTGACRGATFPSSHISAVFVWSFSAIRYLRPLGFILFPLAFGVAISTVYLGYHYALDSLFGLLLALICYPAALKIIKYRDEDPVTNNESVR
ncbi:MAG: phosphatase PAP2 family protein [Candidatus Aminicenantes bacterium]|nr:MAG: phosphatase PAP2 family protein [Candidatus Aminicenantes bacterium]